MSYRICCITHVGYEEVGRAMRQTAAARSSSFAALERYYSEQGFIHGDSLADGMRALGNDSMQILYNLEVLQKSWAAENAVAYGERTWPQEIALAQIKAWRPDVVLIEGLHRDPKVSLVPTRQLRGECRFLKLIVAISGFPMEPEAARFVDVVAANSPELCRHYRNGGAAAELVYHAFDGRIPGRVAEWRRSRQQPTEGHEFTFSGSTGLGWGWGHRSRYYDLVYLLAATGLTLWGHERVANASLRPLDLARLAASVRPLLGRLPAAEFVAVFRRLTETAFGSDLPALPLSGVFPDRCHGALFGIAMYDLFARSRLSFNRHTDAGADVGNMRMFHATGLGSCLVTDGGVNLRDLFEPDSEVVVYRGSEECAEKVRYLLAHEDERLAIAEAGRRRTLRDHTYARRCRQLAALIARALKSGSARQTAPAAPNPPAGEAAGATPLD